MVVRSYKSKSKLLPGVHCISCNDLITEEATQELYIVASSKQRIIKYVGMSNCYDYNRPVKKHNSCYHRYLRKYPEGYIIFRFKCEKAGELERAGLEMIKNALTWNRATANGFELTEEATTTIENLCITYNLQLKYESKEA